MIFVVDASVAMKWFVAEDLHSKAHELLDHQDALRAPGFIVSEIANIVWKKSTRKEISRQQARLILKELTEIPDYIPAFYPTMDLAERALEMALTLGHPVYDCLYLACAEATGGVLITADHKFLKTLRDTEFERLVRYLGEPGFLKEDTETLPPLEIPLRKVEDIIRASELLKRVEDNVHDKLTAGMELPAVSTGDLKPIFDSPAYRALRSLIENLSETERADILALGWLGRRHEGREWQPIRDRAEEWANAHPDDRSIMYICGQTYYLRVGLGILRNQS